MWNTDFDLGDLVVVKHGHEDITIGVQGIVKGVHPDEKGWIAIEFEKVTREAVGIKLHDCDG